MLSELHPPPAAGVLPELLGRHDNPWWLSRAAVAAALTLAVIVPLCVPRSLAAVARFSKLSVACVCALTVGSWRADGGACACRGSSALVRCWHVPAGA